MLFQLNEILADPITKDELKLETENSNNIHVMEGRLISKSGNVYIIKNGIADLMIKAENMQIDSKLYESWNITQTNGSLVYQQFPQFNCSVDKRKETKLFKDFCAFNGVVLDVGCGPTSPAYFNDNDKIELGVGIDPLASKIGNQYIKKFDILKAFGEYLPFKDKSFNQISFATSFDHLIDPIKTLNEVRRCLKNDGEAIFWIEDDHKKPTFLQLAYRKSINMTFGRNRINEIAREFEKQVELQKSMTIPSYAEDVFHLKHYRYTEFNELCTSLGFVQHNIKKIRHSGGGVFVKYHII